jgi:DNA repair protein RecN (Recombination protein N)
MLSTLRIKNLALVSDLTLELEPGLNVITGETGAGKSVIIGALNLVLGERADRALIRAGEEACMVEAVFQAGRLEPVIRRFLDENGLEPCDAGELLIKRTFNNSGANRQFVNGSPTSLSTLAALGEWLVDMHGPHDHQSLLHPARQRAMLDAFAHLEPAVAVWAAAVQRMADIRQAISELVVDERTYAQQVDLLRFQVQEITQARLAPDEETALLAEHQRTSNASRLLELSRGALDLLGEGDSALLTGAGQLGRTLQEFERLDPAASEFLALHVQAVGAWRDLAAELSRYADRIDLDPARLAELEERLGLIQTLKRKYGGTLPEVIAFGEEARTRLERLEGREAELARLRAELESAETALWKAGSELSAARTKAAPKLAREVVRHLEELGFRQSRFAISVDPIPREKVLESPQATGADQVEFQFAPNPGEPVRALRAIASSGEMARVMLAIKTVLAAQDEVPVLVFDEVDANVGGETAAVVGLKMAAIARQRQVLCITHLAPVAASAKAHYLVTKETRAGRTLSAIERLSREERVTELARMLGGQSTAARKHAEALLG